MSGDIAGRECGLVLVDKAAGLTSHQVVSCFRRILSIERIGHLGTLDPFATGLLPLLVGGATRLADFVMESEKQYLFTLALGIETDTLDPTGQVVKEAPVSPDWPSLLSAVLPLFCGQIEQVPPVYSALKMKGRPLYEHMRSTGQLPDSIDSKKRLVWVKSLQLVSCDRSAARASLRLVCGKGTYVRSLARDLALSLGSVGHCAELRRERIGSWTVEQAVVCSSLTPGELDREWLCSTFLQSPQSLLPEISAFVLPEKFLKTLASGNVFLLSEQDCVYRQEQPALAFVSVQGSTLLFLAEILFLKEKGMIQVQPQKRICV